MRGKFRPLSFAVPADVIDSAARLRIQLSKRKLLTVIVAVGVDGAVAMAFAGFTRHMTWVLI
jgi:hypothetical protein